MRKNSVRRKNRKSIVRRRRMLLIGGAVLLIFVIYGAVKLSGLNKGAGTKVKMDASKPDLIVDLLDVNPYSRPGDAVEQINGIVIHYTANPGSTAKQNRDYFNHLKDTKLTSVSSNFVVGLDGEIIQCVPTWEVAYASNDRNNDTVSIECCHPDESGKFNEKTYASMVNLTAWLCVKFNLSEKDVIRHYDVTGKNCPKYFVENEKAWNDFRSDVAEAIRAGGYSE